jgi:hypothetical protein
MNKDEKNTYSFNIWILEDKTTVRCRNVGHSLSDATPCSRITDATALHLLLHLFIRLDIVLYVFHIQNFCFSNTILTHHVTAGALLKAQH